jgi:hypothetical protein
MTVLRPWVSAPEADVGRSSTDVAPQDWMRSLTHIDVAMKARLYTRAKKFPLGVRVIIDPQGGRDAPYWTEGAGTRYRS